MGMFDTVLVPCPKCGTKAEFQSKSGDCSLAIYELNEAPSDVLAGLNRDTDQCKKCNTLFGISISVQATVQTLREG